MNQRDVPFVQNVKNPPVAGGNGTDTGQRVVVACKRRTRLPLQVLGRSNLLVFGDRVVRRIPQEVSPLVDVCRPWFHGLLPGVASSDHDNAVRAEHPQDLIHRDVASVFDNNKIDQVVNEWQRTLTPTLHRHLPVLSFLDKPLSCRFYVSSITIEAMYEILAASAQRRCELSIATP